MQRHLHEPRANWRERVASVGLTYHSHVDGPYWDESASYELTRAEVEQLEFAGNTLHRLCLEAAQAVIDNEWWPRLGIPAVAVPSLLRSWERDDFSIYGRFDLALVPGGEPKLLEYNADTPTALVEAAVAQWFWLQDIAPAADQFNSIHERLIEAWRRAHRLRGSAWHFDDDRVAALTGASEDHLHGRKTDTRPRDPQARAGCSRRSQP